MPAAGLTFPPKFFIVGANSEQEARAMSVQASSSAPPRGNAVHFFMLLGGGLAVLFLVLSFFQISLGSYALFLAALFILVYLPGQSLVWLSKLHISRLESVTLALILGLTATTQVYRIARLLRFLPLILLWVAALGVVFVVRIARRPPRREDFAFAWTRHGLVFGLVILLILGVLCADSFRNGLRRPDGSVVVNWHYYDGFTKNNLIRELTHSVPPQAPFAAGITLSYHYAMELFAALLYRHLGLGVFDLLHRLTMPFYFALLVLALYILIRDFARSRRAALWGVFLAVFGTGGLGFLAALLTGYAPYWGKVFYSFYFLDLLSINSFFPSIPVAAAGFFCLSRYFRERGTAWLILSGWFLAVLFEYKNSIPAQVLPALGLTALVYLLRHRDRRPLLAGLMTGLWLIPLALIAYIHNLGGIRYVPKLMANDWIRFPLADLKLGFLAGEWSKVFIHHEPDPVAAFFCLLILAGFFLASFGPGALALPSALRDFIRAAPENPMRFFLVSFFLAGLGLYFFTGMVLEGHAETWINIYFYYYSLIALMILWAERLDRFLEKRRTPAVRAVIAGLLILISVPNTVQFLWGKVSYPDRHVFEKPFLDACDWLSRNTEGNSVVLHNLDTRFVCYFGDRRVVLDNSGHSNLSRHLPLPEINKRTADVRRFFRAPGRSGDVLAKYRVGYVWAVTSRDLVDVPKDAGGGFVSTSPGPREDREGLLRRFYLKPAFANELYTLYRVDQAPVPDSEAGGHPRPVQNPKGGVQP
jgi:hypothetical protein